MLFVPLLKIVFGFYLALEELCKFVECNVLKGEMYFCFFKKNNIFLVYFSPTLQNSGTLAVSERIKFILSVQFFKEHLVYKGQ